MKRIATALALVLALGGTAGCAEYTTTGAPQGESTGVAEVAESLAPAVDPLVGTRWTLTSAASEAVDVTGLEVTAEFADGTMAGQGPVNRYTATYEAHSEGTIEIGPIAATKMAGAPEAMAAEGAYFALLERVSEFEVAGEELQLLAEGEPILEYTAAADPQASADPEVAETQAVADTLVGMTAEEAEAAVTGAGLTYRVIAEDGVFNAVTSDYNPQRVNVEIVDGAITAATVG